MFKFRMLWVCFAAFYLHHATATTEVVWLAEQTDSQNLQLMNVNQSTLNLLKPYMAGLTIVDMPVGVPQHVNMLKQLPNACVGNKIQSPDRASWGVFSQFPQVISPGLRLHVLSTSTLLPWLNTLSKNGPIQLEQLLDNPERFTIGIAVGRSYGTAMDHALKKAIYKRKLLERSGSDIASGLIQMFSKGRVDLLIEYPNVIHHYFQQLKSPPALKSYTLAESPSATRGHVLCSNTPQGKAIIQQFDNAIEKAAKLRAYLDAQLLWFPADLHDDLTLLYNATYNTKF